MRPGRRWSMACGSCLTRRGPMRLAAVVLLGALLSPGQAGAEVFAKHGMSAKDYRAWIDEVTKKNYRPLHVSAHAAGGQPLFAGVAVPNPERLAWVARHDLTGAAYQRLFDGKETRDHRLVSA